MKILLLCNAGMSTSLLVEKMKHHATEQDVIEAHPIGYLANHYNEWDVMLIGPQIRYKEQEVRALCEQHGKHCGVIDMMDYGQVDGQAVYNYAKELAGDMYE